MMTKLKALWLPIAIAVLALGQAATAALLWQTRDDVKEIASEQDYGQPGWVDDVIGAANDAERAADAAEEKASRAAKNAELACRAAGGNFLSC